MLDFDGQCKLRALRVYTYNNMHFISPILVIPGIYSSWHSDGLMANAPHIVVGIAAVTLTITGVPRAPPPLIGKNNSEH